MIYISHDNKKVCTAHHYWNVKLLSQSFCFLCVCACVRTRAYVHIPKAINYIHMILNLYKLKMLLHFKVTMVQVVNFTVRVLL